MSAAIPPRPFPWARYGWILAVLLLLTLLPLLSVLAASFLADANGCTLNEAQSQPCLIMGSDWGGALSFMFVLGWLALLTLPLGGGAAIVALIMLIIHFLAWRNGQAKDALQ
ncbi:hypothetical protein [Devosia sp. 2618]|uniref:hypothetical protein n=1 Tax=Devosia sp. 2618 TaxID=3156454 RepID=UPI003399DF40